MKPLLILNIICLLACQSKQNNDVHGTWTTINNVDNTGLNITDKIEYRADGTFKAIMLSNGDSVISEFSGTFIHDRETETLEITTNGMKFKHKIMALEKEKLVLKTKDGLTVEMKKLK